MIRENLNSLIKDAMLAHDSDRLGCLRMIKAAYMEYLTAKNAKPLDDAAEVGILKKMVSQREGAILEYLQAGREDLVQKEKYEISVIKEFLPAEVSKDEVKSKALEIVKEKEMKLMGGYIRELKTIFPGADGKLISDIVKEIINS